MSIFKTISNSRKSFISLLDTLSVEELNETPNGFNNNIVWNFGHIVVSTQTLSYVRTGIWEDASPVKYLEAYKKDTKPSYLVSKAEIEELKELALSTIAQIETDYNSGKFAPIEAFVLTTYKAEVRTMDEVLAYTLAHDNLHYGYSLALKKLVKS